MIMDAKRITTGELKNTLSIAVSAIGFARSKPEEYAQYLADNEVIPLHMRGEIRMIKRDALMALYVLKRILETDQEMPPGFGG
jgi:hypothetical protein